MKFHPMHLSPKVTVNYLLKIVLNFFFLHHLQHKKENILLYITWGKSVALPVKKTKRPAKDGSIP